MPTPTIISRANGLIELCDQILSYIEEAQRQLRSARNWGIFDILGGGMFATFFKHRKVSATQENLDAVNALLQQLSSELRDVGQPDMLGIDAGDFAFFADYFFDGFFADLYFQNKIAQLGQRIEDTRVHVEKIRAALVKTRGYAGSQL